MPRSTKTVEGTEDAVQWLEWHPDAVKKLRKLFRRYYRENGRDLPWRRTTDPYRVLVAEILLQKTGYRPVGDVWQALIEKYPDVEALAAASVEDVERLIHPLGLHRRARTLLQVAATILETTGGQIPGSEEHLNALPGVGSYMSAAVLSHALDVKAIAVDVNVARVLTRIGGFLPSTLRQGLAFARTVGERIVTQKTHRAVNFGILDLAAQVCRPKPLCEDCPARGLCTYAEELP